MPAHAVTETLLKDVVLIFIPSRASIQVMIGYFGPGIFVCHEQGFSGLFRSYNSGKTVKSSKYNILGVFKFVMTNDHK